MEPTFRALYLRRGRGSTKHLQAKKRWWTSFEQWKKQPSRLPSPTSQTHCSIRGCACDFVVLRSLVPRVLAVVGPLLLMDDKDDLCSLLITKAKKSSSTSPKRLVSRLLSAHSTPYLYDEDAEHVRLTVIRLLDKIVRTILITEQVLQYLNYLICDVLCLLLRSVLGRLEWRSFVHWSFLRLFLEIALLDHRPPHRRMTLTMPVTLQGMCCSACFNCYSSWRLKGLNPWRKIHKWMCLRFWFSVRDWEGRWPMLHCARFF